MRLFLYVCVVALALAALPVHALTEAEVAAVVEKHPQKMRELLAAIDLSQPELHAVREAAEAGDVPAALFALLRHYQSRRWPEALVEPPDNFGAADRAEAEAALRDEFTLQAITATQPRRSDGGLDWEHRGPRSDREWAWMLNRHNHFRDWLAGWTATGEARYAEAISRQVADWVAYYNYPDKMTFSAPWRALEVARRMDDPWPRVFVYLQDAEAFSAEARLLMLSSVPDHADALWEHPSLYGNHLLTESIMLVKIALVWPEFKESDEWLRAGVERGFKLYDKQVFPDGAYNELANHYHYIALNGYQKLLTFLKVAGKHEQFADKAPRIEKMWDYYLRLSKPNGEGPLNNDSDIEPNREQVAEVVDFYDRDDWRSILAGETPPGEDVDAFYPYAGHLVWRRDWTSDSPWVFFDVGPLGTNHQHKDRLQVDVALGEQEILVDNGRYIYQPSPIREYFTGPHGHNVPTVDGNPAILPPFAVKEPMPVERSREGGLRRAAATQHFRSASGKLVEHRRELVGDMEPFSLLVRDTFATFSPVELALRWHFHPSVELEIIDDQTVRFTAGERRGTFRVRAKKGADWTLEHARGQMQPQPAGWYSPRFNVREPASQLTFTTTIWKPTTIEWQLTEAW